MKRFITPVAMKVTREQYENDLKKCLKKLGYDLAGSHSFNAYPILFINSKYSKNKAVSGLESNIRDYYFIIENYNPELFLALAAMTEGSFPIVGEYVIGTINDDKVLSKKNVIYKVLKTDDCTYKVLKLPGRQGYTSEFYTKKCTKKELIKHFTKDNFVLPEKWCFTTTEESIDLFKKWRLNKDPELFRRDWSIGNHYCVNGEKINGWMWFAPEYKKGYTEITFDQFKKYVLKENKNMKKENRFPFKLSPTNARRIINSACSIWKQKLADEWAKDIVLKNNITISETNYNKMRAACNTPQNDLFDDIFGKDFEEVFYKYGQKFKIEDEEYLLCQIETDVCCLIAIDCSDIGNRFQNPINVNCSLKITQEELNLMGRNPILIQD